MDTRWTFPPGGRRAANQSRARPGGRAHEHDSGSWRSPSRRQSTPTAPNARMMRSTFRRTRSPRDRKSVPLAAVCRDSSTRFPPAGSQSRAGLLARWPGTSGSGPPPTEHRCVGPWPAGCAFEPAAKKAAGQGRREHRAVDDHAATAVCGCAQRRFSASRRSCATYPAPWHVRACRFTAPRGARRRWRSHVQGLPQPARSRCVRVQVTSPFPSCRARMPCTASPNTSGGSGTSGRARPSGRRKQSSPSGCSARPDSLPRGPGAVVSATQQREGFERVVGPPRPVMMWMACRPEPADREAAAAVRGGGAPAERRGDRAGAGADLHHARRGRAASPPGWRAARQALGRSRGNARAARPSRDRLNRLIRVRQNLGIDVDHTWLALARGAGSMAGGGAPSRRAAREASACCWIIVGGSRSASFSRAC